MPPPSFSVTASEVMDRAASLMNDTAKTVYTYVAQLPYLKVALDDLEMELQLNNVSVTNKSSKLPIIESGTESIPIPGDLVEIQGMWERLAGSSDPFVEMIKKEFIPPYLNQPNNALLYWNYEDQLIKFPEGGALTSRELRIDYIKSLFDLVNSENSPLKVINSVNYLAYRTAGLCARFVGEDTERADTLDSFAEKEIDEIVGLATKGRQSIATRRRPFRASYRSRGIW